MTQDESKAHGDAGQTDAVDAELQDYNDRVLAAFDQLFEAAKAREEVQFAMALNPEFRGMQDAGWSTAAESMSAIDEYLELINGLSAGPMKIRIALSLYSHLSEASGFYEVPKNMLRIASGDDYNLWPFQHLVDRHRASGEIIAPNANKVMKDLLGHAAELKLDKLQPIILEAFDPEIRNGYAHADYIIWNEEIRLRKRNGGQPRVVSLEEFVTKTNKAVRFFQCLQETIRKYVLSYSQPKKVNGRMNKNDPEMPAVISFDATSGVFSIKVGTTG